MLEQHKTQVKKSALFSWESSFSDRVNRYYNFQRLQIIPIEFQLENSYMPWFREMLKMQRAEGCKEREKKEEKDIDKRGVV